MKKILLVVLLIIVGWTWFALVSGSKNDASRLVSLESPELHRVQTFVRDALAEYDKFGKSALRKYWILPVHEPEFRSSVEVLGRLGNLDPIEPGNAVHPKFNRDSLLVSVNVNGTNIEASLAVDKNGYVIQSFREK